MEHPVRFKGHESFIIREGWLNKGLREVKRDPKVFYQNYGADALPKRQIVWFTTSMRLFLLTRK